MCYMVVGIHRSNTRLHHHHHHSNNDNNNNDNNNNNNNYICYFTTHVSCKGCAMKREMYQVSLLYTTSLTAYVASLITQRKQFLSIANLLTSVREISKISRMFLPHYLLGLPLSLFPSIFPIKMIFPKPLLLFK